MYHSRQNYIMRIVTETPLILNHCKGKLSAPQDIERFAYATISSRPTLMNRLETCSGINSTLL